MELKKFNDQIWLTEVELDGYQVRGALILGEWDVVLVDTLSHPRDMVPLLPLIPAHGDMGGQKLSGNTLPICRCCQREGCLTC